MNKNIAAFIVFFVLVFAAGIYYYSRNYQSASNATQTPAQTPAQTQNQTPAQENPQATVSNISIQNFAFNPATLTVKPGTTVIWTNNDTAPHQIKSEAFNSASMSKGQTFSFTFPDAGTYDYFCSIHPSMKGRIIVQ
jgi:plastocyanin